jgi:hypothetical protein
MKYILLMTGGGFSRNWGGWLADDPKDADHRAMALSEINLKRISNSALVHAAGTNYAARVTHTCGVGLTRTRTSKVPNSRAGLTKLRSATSNLGTLLVSITPRLVYSPLGASLSSWAFAIRLWVATITALYVSVWLQLDSYHDASRPGNSLPDGP